MTRRGPLGQAAIEIAISLPVIALVAFGGVDIGRAFYFRTPVGAMASAGARFGAVSSTNDIGAAVRQESSVVPDTAASWGQAYTDGTHIGTESDCSNHTLASQRCGDPGGCAMGSSFWTTPGPGVPGGARPDACFAVRSCTIDTSATSAHTGGCTQPAGCAAATSAWQTRPVAAASLLPPQCLAALQVVVVYRFTPSTPVIGSFFAATGNYIVVSSTMTALEAY